LRRYSKVKAEFMDDEVEKMKYLKVIKDYLGAW
jgi:hypothetical protein